MLDGVQVFVASLAHNLEQLLSLYARDFTAGAYHRALDMRTASLQHRITILYTPCRCHQLQQRPHNSEYQ
jgi:hypothetical protein